MAYNNVLHIHRTAALVDYLLYGNGEKKRLHVEGGTHRAAHVRCDAGGVEPFLGHCEAITRAHSRRRIQCHSIVQSFPAGEFDPSDAADVDRMNEIGYRLAHRLAPGAFALVISHVDGESGCPHNHILVANEQNGRAVTCMGVPNVRAANNGLMREEGLEVLNEPCSEWAEKRPRVHSELALFLGDNVDEALRSSGSVQEFADELARRGITIRDRRRNGEPLDGWRYETTMLNDPGGKRKAPRGHKASGLCKAFTREAVEARFAAAQPAVLQRDLVADPLAASETGAGPGEEPASVGLGEAEARHHLEALYAEARNRAQRGGGKYAALNMEMRDLLADVGHARFRRIVRDLNAETRRRVREVEELEARKRELGERSATERALAAGSRAALAKGDVVAALLMLMWQRWVERQRLLLLAQQEQAVRDARPAKWDAENAENAACRVLDEFERYAARHEDARGMEDEVGTFGTGGATRPRWEPSMTA